MISYNDLLPNFNKPKIAYLFSANNLFIVEFSIFKLIVMFSKAFKMSLTF